MKTYVTDTSAIVERIITKLIKSREIRGKNKIIIPNAVIAELENQANKGLEIGFIGLDEIQSLQKNNNFTVTFVGPRPTETQIKFAKSGEIDALIRDIATKQKAILVTCDKVQAESAKAYALEVKYIRLREIKEKLSIEKFFDDKTMSVHLIENCVPKGKKGKPGDWKLVNVGNKKIGSKEIQDISKEIFEKSRIDPETFVEISRRGSTIIQYKNYRIVIVRPPVADGWEITAVRPLKKLSLDYYKLSQELFRRIKHKSRGVIIAGEPGGGKSTFAQALGEFYLGEGKVVKTVESPRDLQLPDDITQYSKNYASSAEIHDILFLSRPDNIIFDEMRDTPDFELYTDLRLGGSECIGVIHSASPIDAVQRFISRLDVGLIPTIIDTIIFINAGKIAKIYNLSMKVKVPNGMTESDLARPVVEVFDFENNKLEYEIYSYGEQTVVMPVDETKKVGSFKLAERTIEKELRRYVTDVKVEVVNENQAIIYVPEREVAKIIGKRGQNISKLEKNLGISLKVEEM